MIKFVHNEGKINPIEARMIPPGFSEGMGAKVSPKSGFITNIRDEFPGLSTSNRFPKIIPFQAKEDEMICVCYGLRVGN